MADNGEFGDENPMANGMWERRNKVDDYGEYGDDTDAVFHYDRRNSFVAVVVGSDKVGYLETRKQTAAGWKLRWVELKDGKLICYRDESRNCIKFKISLEETTLVFNIERSGLFRSRDDMHRFEIRNNDVAIVWACKTALDREIWVKALTLSIAKKSGISVEDAALAMAERVAGGMPNGKDFDERLTSGGDDMLIERSSSVSMFSRTMSSHSKTPSLTTPRNFSNKLRTLIGSTPETHSPRRVVRAHDEYLEALNEITMAGYLEKCAMKSRFNTVFNVKRRYFVLFKNMFSYYSEEGVKRPLRDIILNSNSQILDSNDGDKRFGFEVLSGENHLIAYADSEETKGKWIYHLRQAIEGEKEKFRKVNKRKSSIVIRGNRESYSASLAQKRMSQRPVSQRPNTREEVEDAIRIHKANLETLQAQLAEMDGRGDDASSQPGDDGESLSGNRDSSKRQHGLIPLSGSTLNLSLDAIAEGDLATLRAEIHQLNLKCESEKREWVDEREDLLHQLSRLKQQIASGSGGQGEGQHGTMSALMVQLFKLQLDGYIEAEEKLDEVEDLYYTAFVESDIRSVTQETHFSGIFRRFATEPIRIRDFLDGVSDVLATFNISKERLAEPWWRRQLANPQFMIKYSDSDTLLTWAEDEPWLDDTPERYYYNMTRMKGKDLRPDETAVISLPPSPEVIEEYFAKKKKETDSLKAKQEEVSSRPFLDNIKTKSPGGEGVMDQKEAATHNRKSASVSQLQKPSFLTDIAGGEGRSKAASVSTGFARPAFLANISGGHKKKDSGNPPRSFLSDIKEAKEDTYPDDVASGGGLKLRKFNSAPTDGPPSRPKPSFLADIMKR